jgi:hypothetical protein
MLERYALQTGNDDLKMIALSSLISSAMVGPLQALNQNQTGSSDDACTAFMATANNMARMMFLSRTMSDPQNPLLFHVSEFRS